jgi:hypothetical protein
MEASVQLYVTVALFPEKGPEKSAEWYSRFRPGHLQKSPSPASAANQTTAICTLITMMRRAGSYSFEKSENILLRGFMAVLIIYPSMGWRNNNAETRLT